MLLQTKLVFLFAVTVLASGTISFGQDQERSDPLEPLISYEEAFVFGLVEGDDLEYGYFTLDELERIGAKRDYNFKLKVLREEENYGQRNI